MADETDVLLKLWEGQWAQARHTESQRAIVGNFVITISAAIIGFFGVYGLKRTSSGLDLLPSLLLAILLIVLGIYGVITSLKLYERWHLHTTQARYWRHRINELHPNAKLEELKKEAKEKHESKCKSTYINSRILKLKLYQLWIGLHILVFIFGVAFLIIIINLIFT